MARQVRTSSSPQRHCVGGSSVHAVEKHRFYNIVKKKKIPMIHLKILLPRLSHRSPYLIPDPQICSSAVLHLLSLESKERI